MSVIAPASAAMMAAAISLLLPMPACHASRSITTLLCGGDTPVTITIPVGEGRGPLPGFEFAKACHACKHEDETPDIV